MSSEPGSVRLVPERKRCGRCRRPLQARNTATQTVMTLTGEVSVTEVTLHCKRHRGQVFHPVNTLVPPHSTYAYDVIAEAGRLRFHEHKLIREIEDEFRKRGLRVPRRTVQWLCDRFMEFVYAVHLESMSLLAEFLERQGGYVLHLDGSGNSGRMVILMKDGWSKIRLLVVPVASEAEEHVAPLLRLLKDRLGPPVAVVCDDSKGLWAAVRAVFPGTYIILCHFHFLRDVGVKLFEPLYPRFRNKLDRLGVKKRLRKLRRVLRRSKEPDEEARLALELVEHILSYAREGKGLAYPLSLPAVSFYRRCEEASARVRKEILARAKANKQSVFLSSLEDILRLLKPPPIVLGRLNAEFHALEERWRWFERVRRALRYRNGPIPLSTQVKLSEKDLEKGRRKLDWVRRKIEEFDENGGVGYHDREFRKALRKVGAYIDKHHDSLFAPNVEVRAGGSKMVKRLPRTNAPVEMEFRRLRRHGRRIRGNADVEPQVQRDGAGMLVAENLKDPEYVRLVYGSSSRIAKRFAGVPLAAIRQAKSLLGGPPPP
ncbi:MAG TPA: transposase [Rubrobacteraceae bacterium]|nr:transposase [Rubrobacteraceae bacterium]